MWRPVRQPCLKQFFPLAQGFASSASSFRGVRALSNQSSDGAQDQTAYVRERVASRDTRHDELRRDSPPLSTDKSNRVSSEATRSIKAKAMQDEIQETFHTEMARARQAGAPVLVVLRHMSLESARRTIAICGGVDELTRTLTEHADDTYITVGILSALHHLSHLDNRDAINPFLQHPNAVAAITLAVKAHAQDFAAELTYSTPARSVERHGNGDANARKRPTFGVTAVDVMGLAAGVLALVAQTESGARSVATVDVLPHKSPLLKRPHTIDAFRYQGHREQLLLNLSKYRATIPHLVTYHLPCLCDMLETPLSDIQIVQPLEESDAKEQSPRPRRNIRLGLQRVSKFPLMTLSNIVAGANENDIGNFMKDLQQSSALQEITRLIELAPEGAETREWSLWFLAELSELKQGREFLTNSENGRLIERITKEVPYVGAYGHRLMQLEGPTAESLRQATAWDSALRLLGNVAECFARAGSVRQPAAALQCALTPLAAMKDGVASAYMHATQGIAVQLLAKIARIGAWDAELWDQLEATHIQALHALLDDTRQPEPVRQALVEALLEMHRAYCFPSPILYNKDLKREMGALFDRLETVMGAEQTPGPKGTTAALADAKEHTVHGYTVRRAWRERKSIDPRGADIWDVLAGTADSDRNATA